MVHGLRITGAQAITSLPRSLSPRKIEPTAARLIATYGLDAATGAEQFILVPEGDNPFHQYDLMAETRALLTA